MQSSLFTMNASSFMPKLSLGGVSASVLDDAKSKAKELESKASNTASSLKDQASAEISKGVGKAQNVAAGGSGTIPLYSGKFYLVSALGGAVACGATHGLVTPLDLVKCRKQVDKNIYKSNMDGWSKIFKNEGGFRGL